MSLRQEMVTGGNLADGRRWYSWSRRHCLCFILVFVTVFVFYSTNIIEKVPDWDVKGILMPNHSTKWWIPYQRQNVVSYSTNDSSISGSSTPGSTAEPTTAATAAATTGSSSSGSSLTENITSVQEANMTTPQHTTKVPLVTRHTTEKTTVRPLPVPYVSPGQYVVEYPYEYHFVINEPQTCEWEKPFVVLMVPVAPHNRKDRDIIRSTWGSESPVHGKVVKLFFLLGLEMGAGAEQLQERLQQESKEHRDLLQSDFLDCYKNLTIKTMVMLEWLNSFCSSAAYAMKIDSDMFLNVPNLVNMLLNAPKMNYLTGLVAKGGAVLRDPRSKWYLPVELYPQSQYPRYALGLGYILSLDLSKKLIEASRHIKAVYIEDVYVGLCMQHLGIPPTDPPDWGYFHVFPLQYSRCAFSRIIATTTHPQSDRVWVWRDFKKPGPYC